MDTRVALCNKPGKETPFWGHFYLQNDLLKYQDRLGTIGIALENLRRFLRRCVPAGGPHDKQPDDGSGADDPAGT